MKAVILAAGRGTRLEPITQDIPKCLVPVGGVPLIDRMIARLGEAGIDRVIVVTGHCCDVLEKHLTDSDHALASDAKLVYNDKYATWGNFYSLLLAQDMVWDNDFLKLDGDVLIDDRVIPAVLAADGPLVLTVDRTGTLGEEEMKVRVDDSNQAVELNKKMSPGVAIGESIGIERIDAAMVPSVFGELRAMIDEGETDDYYERAYERLMQQGIGFGYADVTDFTWCEIDDAADLDRANRIVEGQ